MTTPMLRPWKVQLGEGVSPHCGLPVHAQIARTIVREIERGRLIPGTFLPSSRELAATLGVNRKTVTVAYDDLVAQGWVEPSSTRGTIVCAPPNYGGRPAPIDKSPFYRFMPAPARPLALQSRELKLDEGAPDGRLFPPELLTRAYRTAVHRAARTNNLQYRAPHGSPSLREGIASMLRTQRGLRVTADNICITRGGQSSIFLATQILLQPGDGVIVEELSYEPAVAAFRQRGAEIVPVAMDRDGIDPDDVERACRANRIRSIFLTPHHQFPTTVSLAASRRMRIIELARKYGFAVIEDDYDQEFHFDSNRVLPMAAEAPEQVVYVGSLSKLLLPALRIGYIAAPEAVINSIANIVSMVDGMGNTVTEEAVADLISSGELHRHTRKVHHSYARRRLSFAKAIDAKLGGLVEYDMPHGGLAFWLRLLIDPERLDRNATRHALSFAPSRSFMTRESAPSGLRLGFASLTEAEACSAIDRLRAAALG